MDERDTVETLREEAKELAQSIRGYFILLIGAGAFMVVTLSIPDADLVRADSMVAVPVVDLTLSLSALITFGPVAMVALLVYMHFFVGRLLELERTGIHAPQVHVFTMRTTAARVCSDLAFYVYAPVVLAWFFVRTSFRPEAVTIFALAAGSLLLCAVLFWRRTRERASLAARWLGTAYGLSAAVAVALSGVVLATAGRAPFFALVELDLEQADLRSLELDLRGFDFSGRNLRLADLSGLDLRGANFAGADLGGAHLLGTILDDADLSAARLVETNFDEARLTRAILADADMRGSQLTRAELRGAVLDRAKLIGARADGARFDGASLREAELKRAGLAHAVLVGANLTGADLERATVIGASFGKADLTCARLQEIQGKGALFLGVAAPRAMFARADLAQARFTGAKLPAVDFRRADLRSASFTGASLQGADFRTAALDGTTEFAGACPDGARFDATARLVNRSLKDCGLPMDAADATPVPLCAD